MPSICPECGLRWPDDHAFCPNDGRKVFADPMDGGLLAKRQLQRFVGQSTLGLSYLAEHTELGRPETLRVVHASMAEVYPELARAFRKVARSVARLENQHTVRLYEFGETPEGHLYLACERVEGRPLHRLIAAEGPLSPERATRLAAQAAEALAEAHGHRLMHGDFKPANVVVEGEGREERLRVRDFGLASLQPAPAARAYYLSPEQIDGHADVDGRADVFSLGVVLYEMLSGRNPFAAPHLPGTLPRQLTHVPAKLDSVPAAVAAICARMLERDRRARPEAAECLRALRALS